MHRLNLKIRRTVSQKDPFEEDFLRWMNSFFGQQRPHFMPTTRTWTPPTDIYETENDIHIRMELAGVQENDVEVKLSGRYLIVRGKREDTSNVQKENYHLMEIQYGCFQRVFALPEIFSPEDVSAHLENGFLTIILKKRPNQNQEIRIEIQ
ncbi:MAG: Hsp20/alpha crystallin family protein [Candidatus Sumerlaeaceae bacterium]|nr:Hsp20/alpha crystallin family protein [Candidatus Sumerlaeaceae bacterium]